MFTRPKFMHNCKKCLYLGHFRAHDLYYCPDSIRLVARFDHDEADCISTVAKASKDPIFFEAFRRAKKIGLLYKTRTVTPMHETVLDEDGDKS